MAIHQYPFFVQLLGFSLLTGFLGGFAAVLLSYKNEWKRTIPVSFLCYALIPTGLLMILSLCMLLAVGMVDAVHFLFHLRYVD